MKNSIRLLAFFVILFSLPIMLGSCSSESTLTSPNESKVITMAKTVATVTSSINHSTDTVITLPRSGKTIVIDKNLPADKIALLDNYLSTHNISNKPQTVKPYAGYYQVTISYWEMENQFSPAPGKNLGICTNIIPIWNTARPSYGFTSIYVNNTDDLDSAYHDGYSYDNMMLGLTNYNTAFSQIDASNSYGRHVGSYYIDEPIEKGTWDDYTIESVASYSGASSRRIMLGSYKWPVVPQYWSFPVTYGQKYGPIVSSLGNIYIMCDEYHGNCLGHTSDYWNEFKGYYISKNISNWLDVTINNGYGNASSCGYAATSWSTLLYTANYNGIGEVWLYAVDEGDETAILNFCLSAWQMHWNLRLQKHLVIIYQCSGLNCSWPDGGNWTVYAAYYDDQQWVYY